MLAGIILVVALLAVVPAFLMSGMIAAALIGETTTRDAEARFEGSELIDLNE